MSALKARAARRLERIWYAGDSAGITLRGLEGVFRGATALRRTLYRQGLKRPVSLDVPVVVVGNVTVGGTGKTPLVIWLAKALEARGRRPGIISRGYGGTSAHWPRRVDAATPAEEVGDEPVLIAARTGHPVFVGPDRVAAARALRHGAPDVDVVLSDDGLQHYRLARAFEIAVVDGARGFGNGHCLPAGPLREPTSRLDAVDALVWTMGAREDRSLDPPAGAYVMTLVPTTVRRLHDGAAVSLVDFAGQRVHAVAGIGHPERFFATLEHAGLEVVRHPLPDHARLTASDLQPEPGATVLITEKDAVKCRGHVHERVFSLAVDAVLEPQGGAAMIDAILQRLEEKR